jgi:DNA-binding transcriptional MerR regulator
VNNAPPQIEGVIEEGFTVFDPTDQIDELRLPEIKIDSCDSFLDGQEDIGADAAPSNHILDMNHNAHSRGVDVDDQKYRLPEHENGNGTKATPATKVAHLGRMDEPLPPMPVDGPGAYEDPSDEAPSYFNPFGLQRTGSVYTLSRVSFANQLAQLTSLQLPDAESLANKVLELSTLHAAKALVGAAEQIKNWISKATEVLNGLDADDDVEWAAAGGREGLEDVDNAIDRFESLINVYVTAIEELQSRSDIASVPSADLKVVVHQVETILAEWEKIKRTLQQVKSQVGVAIEWEELWNTVLGDIGHEMDILSRLVFEMEEKRHKSLIAEASEEGVDLKDLETIVEETPAAKSIHLKNNRFSVTAAFPSNHATNNASTAQDDSSLLALFARMQPLRASLDFLPMRLSSFHARAENTFPTACEELEERREELERDWKALEKDAESLRRELGEDRWVLVFRSAGRQANKMCDSVERSVQKLHEGIEIGQHINNPSAMSVKMDSYEQKKIHYGPAIERVLSIIEKGVKDRLTVNGEIVRLHTETQSKWASLKDKMYGLDQEIAAIHADQKNQQLRDSVSSLMSNDRSTFTSNNDTPGSSPASSVIMSNLQQGTDPTTPGKVKSRPSLLPQPGSRRRTPQTSSSIPRKGMTPRLSSSFSSAGRASPSPSYRDGSSTPTGNRIPRPSFSSSNTGVSNRPKWNSSVKPDDHLIGHNFKPLSLTTPSPHARMSTPMSQRTTSEHGKSPSISRIPMRSPSGMGSYSPLSPETSFSSSLPEANPKRSFRDRITSGGAGPGPYSQQVLSSPSARPTIPSSAASTPNVRSSRMSMQPQSATRPSLNKRASVQTMDLSPLGESLSIKASPAVRPASSMAGNSRRTSLLPQPRGRRESSVTGRESPQAVAGAASAMRRGSSQVSTGSRTGEKPRWR